MRHCARAQLFLYFLQETCDWRPGREEIAVCPHRAECQVKIGEKEERPLSFSKRPQRKAVPSPTEPGRCPLRVMEFGEKASLMPAIGLPRLPRPFGSGSPIFMPIPAVVVLRLALVLARVAPICRSSSRRSENSTWFNKAGDRAEFLEARFSTSKFEGGSLLFRVARCVMYYATGKSFWCCRARRWCAGGMVPAREPSCARTAL